MPFGEKIFCIPCVKEDAEQKISPRATLSEAKLELKRIIFCRSIHFYKYTTIILFPEVLVIINVPENIVYLIHGKSTSISLTRRLPVDIILLQS
jgi:hypothetical protein